jgi:hypothetical protein
MEKRPPGNPVKTLLEQYSSSTDFLKLTNRFLDDQDAVDGLVDLAISDEIYPFPQYASHLLLHVARKKPGMIEPHYREVVDCVLMTKNTSVQRNLLGVVICMPVEAYKEGELLAWLFDVLNRAESKPGVINYSVHRLAQYIQLYPELEQEIVLTLENRAQQTESAGLVCWGKSVLNKSKTLEKRKTPANQN